MKIHYKIQYIQLSNTKPQRPSLKISKIQMATNFVVKMPKINHFMIVLLKISIRFGASNFTHPIQRNANFIGNRNINRIS